MRADLFQLFRSLKRSAEHKKFGEERKLLKLPKSVPLFHLFRHSHSNLFGFVFPFSCANCLYVLKIDGTAEQIAYRSCAKGKELFRSVFRRR